MSRNAKLILIIVLAVVLVACVILALTMPKKDSGNDSEISETNDTAVESMEGTENVGTEGSGDDLDITIDIGTEESTKPSGNENSGNSNSGNGNSGNSNSGTESNTPDIVIDFDDLLNGGNKDDNTDKDESTQGTTAPTEANDDKKDDSNGPAKVEEQDIVIEF